MKKTLLWLALLAMAANAHAEGAWSKLWRNADQRGETLLRQGKPKEAAAEFSDPGRKAYANYQAGRYADAAHELAKLDDPQADYNRGNALAHAGDLQGALKAYDAALARNPGDADAKKNRALVERALKDAQKRNPNSADGSNASGEKKPQDGKDKDKKQGSNREQGKDQGKAGDDATRNESGKRGNHDNAAGAGQQRNPPSGTPGNGSDADRSQPAAADRQAQRNAQQAAGTAAAGADPGAASKQAPLSEKQISQDQWLRSIPDDPAGLLRRKFMIEHMLRQQRERQ